MAPQSLGNPVSFIEFGDLETSLHILPAESLGQRIALLWQHTRRIQWGLDQRELTVPSLLLLLILPALGLLRLPSWLVSRFWFAPLASLLTTWTLKPSGPFQNLCLAEALPIILYYLSADGVHRAPRPHLAVFLIAYYSDQSCCWPNVLDVILGQHLLVL